MIQIPDISQRPTHQLPLHKRTMPAILRRMAKAGMALEPFLFVREDPDASGLSTDAIQFKYGFIQPEHVEARIRSKLISSREDAYRYFDEDDTARTRSLAPL